MTARTTLATSAALVIAACVLAAFLSAGGVWS